jgi:RimJ/RimL family protein N-acetyltransferase
MPIECETRRLRLRQWKLQYRRPFAALNADPVVMQYFAALKSAEESDAMAARCEQLIAQRQWGFWAAEVKDTSAFIGFVGLHIPQANLPISPCVEIGWRLAHQYWGYGFATEAAYGALAVGFDKLELPEIVAFTVPANRRSRAVMERLGMTIDEATFEHPDFPEGHILRTHCVYRVSRQNWLKLTERPRIKYTSGPRLT